MTAETLEPIASPIESHDRPLVPTVLAGTIRRILAVCAVIACLTFAGCHHSTATAPTIAVTITSPTTSPTIEQGQVVNVTASVANDSTNQGVSWTLLPATGFGALSNSTTSTVTYTAPASVSAATTITVTAASIANPGIIAVFSIHVTPPIAVTISPSTASVPALGGKQGFTASLSYDENSAGVSWSLSGAGCSGATCGSLSNVTTSSVLYVAPATQPSPNVVVLTATSIADHSRSDTLEHHGYAPNSHCSFHRWENRFHQCRGQRHAVHRSGAERTQQQRRDVGTPGSRRELPAHLRNADEYYLQQRDLHAARLGPGWSA